MIFTVLATLPSPTILTVSSTAISITLIWEQPEGADAVEIYEIRYEYSINECIGERDNFSSDSVTVVLNKGSLRSYTLTNSSLTPVEEDSFFFLTLRAVNGAMMSDPTPPAHIETADAGMISSLSDLTKI